jgi:hypothetical protein
VMEMKRGRERETGGESDLPPSPNRAPPGPVTPRHRAPRRNTDRPRGPAPPRAAHRLTPQTRATARHSPSDPAEPRHYSPRTARPSEPRHSALRAAQHRGPTPPSTGEKEGRRRSSILEREGGDGERKWRTAPVQESGDRREEGAVGCERV